MGKREAPSSNIQPPENLQNPSSNKEGSMRGMEGDMVAPPQVGKQLAGFGLWSLSES
jgi:hypothetical protein